MTLWEKLKKGFIEGVQTASEKTSEYTRIGRIKIDVLSLKKEIEEKFIELGGRTYHFVTEEKKYNLKEEKDIAQLIERIKELEAELNGYEEELRRIRENGVDMD